MQQPQAVAGGGADEAGLGAVGPQLGIGLGGNNLFAIVEDMHEKLKILDYEDNYLKPRAGRLYPRTFFCIPTSPAEQFPQFSQLVMWLFKDLGVLDLEWNEFDDPNMICKSIMECAGKLGYQADISEQKLRPGSGESVMMLLNFVLDKCLTNKRFQVQIPKYPDEAAMATTQEPTTADDADAEIEDHVDDDIDEKEQEDDDGTRGNDIGISGEDTMLGILESSIKPEEWLLELERVGPLLKIKKNAEPTKEWRTHLEQSIKYEKELSDAYPEVKASLEKLGDTVRKALDRISGREKHINQQFEHLGSEYREKQTNFEQIRSTYNELSQSVSELTQELSARTDEVDSIKGSMGERNSSMTDTAPLKRIQTAVAALKGEVKHMELRLGVLGQTLLQHKLKHPDLDQPARNKSAAPTDPPSDDDWTDEGSSPVSKAPSKKSAPEKKPLAPAGPSKKGKRKGSDSEDEDLELF
jgi:intraflagellar transport protein 57